MDCTTRNRAATLDCRRRECGRHMSRGAAPVSESRAQRPARRTDRASTAAVVISLLGRVVYSLYLDALNNPAAAKPQPRQLEITSTL